jgi:hypothetical protein
MNGAAFLSEVLRSSLALVLLAAAIGKLRGAGAFQRNLVDSFGLAPGLARVATSGMIVLETLLAALLLLVPALASQALSGTLLLFAVLTIFLGYHFLTRDSVSCSCFGNDARPVSAFDLARNGGLIGACALALFWHASGREAGNAVLAACLGWPLMLIAVHFHDIASALVAPAGER